MGYVGLTNVVEGYNPSRTDMVHRAKSSMCELYDCLPEKSLSQDFQDRKDKAVDGKALSLS